MNIYDVVIDLMRKYPKLRDDDKLLIWNVWGTLGYVKDGVITRADFLEAPSTESIRRSRQKIQETHPELQSSEPVKALKKAKEKDKGTFIYREEVKPKQWVFKNGKAYQV